jgi:uncharacterized surface anchored protein
VDEDKNISTAFKALAGKKAYINYDLTVDKNAKIDTALVNKVYLDYEVGGHRGTIEDEDKLYTYAARIKKVSSGIFGSGIGDEPLQGAEFIIKNAQGKYFGGEIDQDGDTVPEKVWTTKDKAKTFVSGKDGIFNLTGVKEGTYNAEETKAPKGYQKLAEPIEFVVNKLTDGATTGDLDPHKITNDLIYEFFTGSRTLLIASSLAGITIAVGAGTYIYRKKRYDM